MGESNNIRSWLASVVVHLFVFAVFCFLGNVSVLKNQSRIDKPVEITIYDADAALKEEAVRKKESFAPVRGDGLEGGGGGGGGTPAPLNPPEVPTPDAADQVNLPDKSKPVEENNTPFEKSKYNPAYNPPADVNREENGTGYGGTGGGRGGGDGTGHGTGTGSGVGPGSGSGSGGGSGSGTGSGSGSGTGVRPKVPPQVRSAANPVYPEQLRQQNIEGSVRVRIVVAADGSVESASVSESSGYEAMDAAAIEAAYKYSFEPAEDSAGNAVRCAISFTMHFELH